MSPNKIKTILYSFSIIGCLLCSCTNETKDTDSTSINGVTEETELANIFARDVLELYYYWNEEISGELNKLDPETNSNPIATVEAIRYHDGENLIDKWTTLTDNMEEFTNSVQGVSTTYGYTPVVYYLEENSNRLIAAVAYVSKSSPAEKSRFEKRRFDL